MSTNDVENLDHAIINGITVRVGTILKSRNGAELIIAQIKRDRHGVYLDLHYPAKNKNYLVPAERWSELTPIT
jgi:hypothetical protein